MKNVPNKIFLNIGYEPEKGDDFNELGEVTWCADKVNDSDIEYQSKPIWHDLRKDPNDLPKLEDIIIVCKEFMGTEIIYQIECYYPRNWAREASEQKRKRVLAWMEISKFK